MKKVFAILLAVSLMIGLSACGNKPAESKPKIGILQFAPHASLDDCYNGILKGLESKGFTKDTAVIEFVNGMGDSETNRLAAENFVSQGFNIIIAIATPSAMPAYAAAKDAKIPVVFSAVSDQVGAGLVQSLENPGTIATGTTDNVNYDAQLQMIRAFQPDAKRIGILYTTSEANSITQLAEYEKRAGNYGFEIVSKGVTDATEIAAGIQALLQEGVDCINNLTDNNVVNNFSVVTQATDPLGIPCYGSEIQQVAEYGCIASESLDYVALGVTTGEMAAEILNGKDPAGYPVSVVKDSFPCYSSANLNKLNISLPDTYKNAKDTSKD